MPRSADATLKFELGFMRTGRRRQRQANFIRLRFGAIDENVNKRGIMFVLIDDAIFETDIDTLVQRARAGHFHYQTLVSESHEGPWVPMSEIPVLQSALDDSLLIDATAMGLFDEL